MQRTTKYGTYIVQSNLYPYKEKYMTKNNIKNLNLIVSICGEFVSYILNFNYQMRIASYHSVSTIVKLNSLRDIYTVY